MRRTLFLLPALFILFCLMPLCAQASAGEISGFAYLAQDNGIYRDDSRKLSDVTVSLYSLSGSGEETRLARVRTGSDGFYSFTGLSDGTYRLRASLPEGFLYCLPAEGGSTMLPAPGTDSFSMPISVSDGRKYTAHIGASRSSTYIKVIVFEDSSQNGGRSTTEPLLTGVPVTLYYEMNGENVAIITQKTDQNGEAIFLHLTPGTYRVGAVLPAPYIIGPLGEKTSLWYNCVPPCDSNEGISVPITAVKGDSAGVGVGAVSSGSLAGTVWWDENMDGKRSAGEGGYAGASVKLSSDTAGVSREIITTANGAYRFQGLLAGEYTLTVTLPEDAMFTLPGGGSPLTAGNSFSDSCTVQVADKTEGRVPDIGVMPVTALQATVYNDLNVNGRYDPEEPAFAGATLQAVRRGAVLASAASDGEGKAFIPVLRGGETEVRLILPDGQVFTVEGENNDFYTLSATSDLTLSVDIPHGECTELYAGVTMPASVHGTLFNDIDLSGIMEANETGLADFTVQAVNAAGEVAAQTSTDAEGRYSFRFLLPAAHTIRFLLTDAYVCTDYSETGAAVENRVIDQTPDYGETDVLELTPGKNMENISCGIFRSATVSGQVLLDTGIPAFPAQGGMEGVQVALIDEAGQFVSDTTTALTDAEGDFYLKGALPGTYRLRFTLPENAAFTDTSLKENQLTSEPFVLNVADDMVYDTLRAIYTGCLAGRVYRDNNVSGAFDDEESVLGDLPVRLEHQELGLAYKAETREDGSYLLTGLRPGTYIMKMMLPDGLCFAYDPSSPISPQVNQVGMSTLSIGIRDMQEDRNIAVTAPARLNGTVFFDLQNNGSMDAADPGAEGVTISFTSDNFSLSYTVQTDDMGHFYLNAMVPGVYTIRATLDTDCVVADQNNAKLREGYWTSRVRVTDGMTAELRYPILRLARVAGHVWSLDGTLNGVSERRVTLYMEGMEDPLAEMQTNGSGAFAFGDLKPGRYKLTCDLPDSRYNYARPADAALREGKTDVPVGYYDYFEVSMGANLRACDIGIGAMGSLGDTAWLDLDGNGLHDSGEPCLPGISIRVYQYGELVGSAVTDNQGHYLIEGLYPGLCDVEADFPDEIRPTLRRTDYPLAASVLDQSEGGTAIGHNVVIPSAGRNLNCDLGFVLVKEGVYPANLTQLYSTDWSYGGKRK